MAPESLVMYRLAEVYSIFCTCQVSSILNRQSLKSLSDIPSQQNCSISNKFYVERGEQTYKDNGQHLFKLEVRRGGDGGVECWCAGVRAWRCARQ